MAVTASAPGKLTLAIWQAYRDDDPIKVMLIDGDTWSYDLDTSQFVDEVTGEVTGTGYTSGGLTLSNVSESYNSGANAVVVDADDPVWDAEGGELSAERAVFYIDTGNTETSPVIAVWDFDGEVTATNDTYTLTLAGTGLLRVAVS